MTEKANQEWSQFICPPEWNIGVEEDLRQNLGESKEEIPGQFAAVYDTQM